MSDRLRLILLLFAGGGVTGLLVAMFAAPPTPQPDYAPGVVGGGPVIDPPGIFVDPRPNAFDEARLRALERLSDVGTGAIDQEGQLQERNPAAFARCRAALNHFRTNGFDPDREGDPEMLALLEQQGLPKWNTYFAAKAGWADPRYTRMAGGMWNRCEMLRSLNGLNQCAHRYGQTPARLREALENGFRRSGFELKALTPEAKEAVERIFKVPAAEMTEE